MKKIVWLLLLAFMTAGLAGCGWGDDDNDRPTPGPSNNDKVSDVLDNQQYSLFTTEELAAIDNMTGVEIVAAANTELDTANADGSISQDELEKINAFYKMAAEKSDEGKVLYSISSVATAADLVANITSGAKVKGKVGLPQPTSATNYIKASLVDSYYNDVVKEIDQSLALLNSIDSSFDVNMTFGGVAYDVDYGDVLSLKAALEASKISLVYLYAYEVKSDDNYNRLYDFFVVDDTFMVPGNGAEAIVASQKETMLSMLANIKAASESIAAETDNQANDLVVANSGESAAEDEETFLEAYEAMVDSINGTADLQVSKVFALDLSKLFTVLPLRGYLSGSDDDSFGGLFIGDDATLQSLRTQIDMSVGNYR
jgi:hypothetical protein